MARSFISLAMQTARAIDRDNRRRHREAIQQARATERDFRAMQRDEKRQYQHDRGEEAEALNEGIRQAIDALERILLDGLARNARIDWQALARLPAPSLEGDSSLKLVPIPDLASLLPKMPGFMARLLPGRLSRHEVEVEAAKAKHVTFLREHHKVAQRRADTLAQHQREANAQAREIAGLRDRYLEGGIDSVCQVFDLVLESSPLPDGFPRNARIGYTPQSRQLVVDYQLPTMSEIVPDDERFRYNKTSDEITSTKRTARARSALYSKVVSATVLRCLHEIFQADEGSLVDVVVVNAFVDTTDPSTGKRVQPYLVSVRTTRGQFGELSLANVDPVQCLKRLSASVSRSPAELAPVKPIVDINMSDPRFIKETDVLSTLDTRPNLMELTPSEFESLITNLFGKMGLETKLTQASRDGGVDCVAFDLRPIIGGKVIVQAKRYKNTVGVSAVRDLFGTMHNEGASKGILVATSGYGSATFDFAKGKPIELIDGSHLLYLLQEHAGVDAKIVMPDDWVDPLSDAFASSAT